MACCRGGGANAASAGGGLLSFWSRYDDWASTAGGVQLKSGPTLNDVASRLPGVTGAKTHFSADETLSRDRVHSAASLDGR